MNTGQLTKAVADTTGLDASQARDAVNAVIYAIQTEVKRGGKVSIAGFGSFEQTKRKARKGRNPKTGEAVKIPAKKVPKFLAGRVFKEVVNGKRKIVKPTFLTQGLTRRKLMELCKVHGIDVRVGTVAKKPTKRKASKKTTKKPAKKKVTARKKAVRKNALKAASTRRKKK